ncbi:CCA tRNA nucleotidyltransferase 1, mitochondrial-like isoform X2 [Watersipora subatra]|uniref:CCA tRNA nucleotidyltransferase 1, mitochondrial-like isoform X2 n=1 Tax=Watersipora subatra TaxID=2589382 RepID=UPI00355B5683
MKTVNEQGCSQRLIDSQAFKDIFVPELKTLREICDRNNMEIRIAGGAVRDILLGIVPHDIDFATTTHPERMVEIFTKEGVRMIEYGARAIGHGTVSVRINDSVNYEITTTRSDVLTNGRHATVEFHTDWKRDANRRDLTINSMFLGLDGTLYDYFNGYNDLMDKRVLFVGNARDRITEDYLRIMRYFRFYGRIKANPEDHDAQTLEVIGQTAEGLKGVAGERIWVELKKILSGHFADHQMSHIAELGVAAAIGLPMECNLDELTKVYARSSKFDITEAALLAAVFHDKQQVEDFKARLKVSNQEYATALFIVEQRSSYECGQVKRYQDMIVDSTEKKMCSHRFGNSQRQVDF